MAVLDRVFGVVVSPSPKLNVLCLLFAAEGKLGRFVEHPNDFLQIIEIVRFLEKT